MLTGWNDIDRMFGAMDLFRTRMNRLFNDFDSYYRSEPVWLASDNWPRTNLFDHGEFLELLAEVPGVVREDLNVRIQGNYLEISGCRKTAAPEGYTTHKAERGALEFCRSFTLPSDIDSAKVEATLKNGILGLKLPKAEAAKPKKIDIK